MRGGLGHYMELDGSHAGSGVLSDASDHKLRVTVIHTNAEGTLAALRTAGGLAKNLRAQIAVIDPIVVPWRLPLDTPLVPVNVLRGYVQGLVVQSGIDPDEVVVRTRVCRTTRECLRDILPYASLVVIGGKQNWWSREEQQLGEFLRALGHQVIIVNGDLGNSSTVRPSACRNAVFRLRTIINQAARRADSDR